MKDLSLHILDLAQNSVSAGASRIEVHIVEDQQMDLLRITIEDDGCGMDEDFLRHVISPFATTRTTRKVGLGIPLFIQNAQHAGGDLEIVSKVGVGTTLVGTLGLSHIDRPPMGDVGETILTLVSMNPTLTWVFSYQTSSGVFSFDTQEIISALGSDISLDTPDVVLWMKEYLSEGIESIHGGA